VSFFKYYSEKFDSDGEALTWPGGPEGYPFRGPTPPQTTEEEFQNLKVSGKFRCRTFYLDKPEDMADYIKVRDKCSNAYFILIDRDRQWDEDIKNYRIFIEWVEPGYDSVLGGANDAVKKYTQHATTIQSQPGPTGNLGKLAGLRKDW